MGDTVPVLVITGTVGVGKTSVATEVSEILWERAVAHALIDLDWLRWCAPRPPDDPFHLELGLLNLEQVWTNYRSAGAERLILVDVVETGAEVLDYKRAVPGAAIQVIRLHAALTTILRRLEGRERGASLIWHQQRAPELIAMMERNGVGDLLVDTDGRQVDAIAGELLRRAGWIERDDIPKGA